MEKGKSNDLSGKQAWVCLHDFNVNDNGTNAEQKCLSDAIN
jgi:hypothetical protein